MQPTFLFDDRKRFDAECDHDRLKSSIQSDSDTPSTADPWKQPPVDFTMKNFHPNRKKNRHSSSSSSSIEQILSKKKLSEDLPTYNPAVMRPFAVSYQNTTKNPLGAINDNEKDVFLLNKKIKYDKVKRVLNTEQYKNPQPHDFRQYPDIKVLGLSEFQTSYNRDPYNLQFHSDHLNTLWLQERENERIPNVEKPLLNMYRTLTARPQWESRLVLPKLVFPNKYAAYTRYRNPTRTVQTAYWERVEDRFGHKQNKHLNMT